MGVIYTKYNHTTLRNDLLKFFHRWFQIHLISPILLVPHLSRKIMLRCKSKKTRTKTIDLRSVSIISGDLVLKTLIIQTVFWQALFAISLMYGVQDMSFESRSTRSRDWSCSDVSVPLRLWHTYFYILICPHEVFVYFHNREWYYTSHSGALWALDH